MCGFNEDVGAVDRGQRRRVVAAFLAVGWLVYGLGPMLLGWWLFGRSGLVVGIVVGLVLSLGVLTAVGLFWAMMHDSDQ
ncbi:hypothetical protein [Mycobacterium sp. Marseille-P9652]|uniref:hypothetical protein n=1 Tax=Mycobacterium sp. Marseille-P9652 TaxID=2654950 RepID=UPI0018D05298|nr:hypothetical protein [Mycobacterium sp. Marseille-P9652]